MGANHNLMHIFNRARGCGSTQAIIDGLKGKTGAVVLAHSERYAKDLCERIKAAGADATVLNLAAGVNQIYGRSFSGPVLIDLPASMLMAEEWERSVIEAEELAKQLDEARAEIERLRAKNEMLADQVVATFDLLKELQSPHNSGDGKAAAQKKEDFGSKCRRCGQEGNTDLTCEACDFCGDCFCCPCGQSGCEQCKAAVENSALLLAEDFGMESPDFAGAKTNQDAELVRALLMAAKYRATEEVRKKEEGAP